MTDEEIAEFVSDNIAELRSFRRLAIERAGDALVLAGRLREAINKMMATPFVANPWADHGKDHRWASLEVRELAGDIERAIDAARSYQHDSGCRYQYGSDDRVFVVCGRKGSRIFAGYYTSRSECDRIGNEAAILDS